MKGKLIVIDGPDGSGKRTQAEILVKRLMSEGRKAELVSFPQYEGSFFGELAGRYLRGEFGPAEGVSPFPASLAFTMDRWEARPRIQAWLDAGVVVVADRYVSSNAGHQAIKVADAGEREAFVRWVERMEYEVLGLPRPDLCVFLHVPWAVAKGLVARKQERNYLKGAREDVHEADDSHLARAEQAYLLMARGAGWRTVECCEGGRLRSVEEIAGEVWAAAGKVVGG
ncbi:MAG TPA: thymidylate kinase [Candidatus Brocadiia bacterium]|nr:thymidylate kinase [Candidatus Brocadiia bacterium]